MNLPGAVVWYVNGTIANTGKVTAKLIVKVVFIKGYKL